MTWGTSAAAEDEPSAPKEAQPTQSSAKRAQPDYDGRGGEPVHDGAGVWLGRILLSPLYFTTEYLLRLPLGAVTIAAERADLLNKIYDFFAFGPDHKAGVVPVAFWEFGFVPSVGAWGFWDDAFFVRRNQLRVHYEFWPDDAWLAGSITDRYSFDREDRRVLQLRVAGLKRPDQPFYGIGPSSLNSNQSRYTITRFDMNAMMQLRGARSSVVEAAVGLRKADMTPGDYLPDPSLEAQAATGAFPVPFGFNRGYLGPYARVLGKLDTRPRGATRGSGVRLEAQVEEGTDLEHDPSSSWVRYGAVATGFLDLNDRGRVLGLSLAALFADPLGSEPIPFTELVSLGGDKWMVGYYPGRLLGRSAVVAMLHYTWPIAPWIDATLQAAFGNAFDQHLAGFDVGLLRFSGSFGISTATSPPVQLLLGFGTETFESGGKVTSAHLAFGFPHSF